jgi:hypothetical protein
MFFLIAPQPSLVGTKVDGKIIAQELKKDRKKDKCLKH